MTKFHNFMASWPHRRGTFGGSRPQQGGGKVEEKRDEWSGLGRGREFRPGQGDWRLEGSARMYVDWTERERESKE